MLNNSFPARADGVKENIRKHQIAALVPLSEAYPDINRVSENGSVFARRSARLGAGKRRIWTKSDTLKRGASAQLAQSAHLKRMALADLPVPKKGELTQIWTT